MSTAAPTQKKVFRLVPFNPIWISHDKLDLHAIYRRPHYGDEDEYGEKHITVDQHGMPTWDLTGPLPVKQHNKWTAKGFEYVTLADRDSLMKAAEKGTLVDEEGNPCHWREYDQHQQSGPWNYRQYRQTMEGVTTAAADLLRRDVEEFGSEVVERLRRRTEPHFRLPEHLRDVKPGGKKTEPKG